MFMQYKDHKPVPIPTGSGQWRSICFAKDCNFRSTPFATEDGAIRMGTNHCWNEYYADRGSMHGDKVSVYRSNTTDWIAERRRDKSVLRYRYGVKRRRETARERRPTKILGQQRLPVGPITEPLDTE